VDGTGEWRMVFLILLSMRMIIECFSSSSVIMKWNVIRESTKKKVLEKGLFLGKGKSRQYFITV
jgi:hypothetical protein